MDMLTMIFSRLPLSKSRNPALNLQVSTLDKLGSLLDNGYPVLQALSVMEWDERIADISKSIAGHLKTGLQIDEAFKAVQFDDEIITYLYFARSSGELPATIKQCAEMMKTRMASAKKFKQITRYPVLLLLLSIILLWFVKQSVYPAFYDLFSSSGTVSPILTVSIMFIDLFFRALQLIFLITLLSVPAIFILQQYANVEFQLQFFKKIPLYRRFLRKRVTFLFSIHLSALFRAGLSPKEAFMTIHSQDSQPILSFYASRICEELEDGIPLAAIFPSLYFLEPDLRFIFQKHATTSWIEKDLAAYARFLVEQMEDQIKKAATFIQPAVFCLLGLLIVFIYLSIMLPMFQLINSI